VPHASPAEAPEPAAGPSRPHGTALVIGAGGGLGAALAAALRARALHAQVLVLGRGTAPALDFLQPGSFAPAAQWVDAACGAADAPLRTLLVATGVLHADGQGPERSWDALDADWLARVFQVNAIGPALVVRHFLPLLARRGPVRAGFLSARVGSIGDNALGGWYGYRASKAALNQIVRTAAIELRRRNPAAVCVALHPGTVDTGLSRPFAKAGLRVRPPDVAAGELLQVLEGLDAAATGSFRSYDGQSLPW
jgi:NAD(P)-dependent dehydrogenase (short-subunit alcohol dehydrogenase family)